MGKKVNVKELLESAITDSMDTTKEVQGLREERRENVHPNHRKNTETKGSILDTGTDNAVRLKGLSHKEQKNVKEFGLLLEGNEYTDKKEQFIFRLSQECFEDYERLAHAYTYKLGRKVSRNDIMRKVLEKYHRENIKELLNNIDTIS